MLPNPRKPTRKLPHYIASAVSFGSLVCLAIGTILLPVGLLSGIGRWFGDLILWPGIICYKIGNFIQFPPLNMARTLTGSSSITFILICLPLVLVWTYFLYSVLYLIVDVIVIKKKTPEA